MRGSQERLSALFGRIRGSVLARDVSNLWTGQVVVVGAGLTQAVVAARILGPEDFGAASLIIGAVTLVYTVLNPQSSDTVVRYLTTYVEEDDRRRAAALPKFTMIADGGLAVFATVLIASTAGFVSEHVIGRPGAAPLLLAYAVLTAGSAPAATATSILTVLGRFGAIARLQAASAVVRAGAVVTALAAGKGIAGLVIASGLGLLMEGLLLAVTAERSLRRTIGSSWLAARLDVLRDERWDILRFTGYSGLTTMVTAAVKHADLVLLGALSGPVQAGYYRLARTLVQPLGAVAAPMQSSVYPRLRRLAVSDGRAIPSSLKRYLLFLGVPTSILVLLGLPLAGLAVRVIAGQEFVPATPAVQWLLAGSAVAMLVFWLRPAMLALDHVRFLFLNSAAAAAVSLVGFVLVAAPFGAAGVAAVRVGVATILASASLLAYLVVRLRSSERRRDHDETPDDLPEPPPSDHLDATSGKR